MAPSAKRVLVVDHSPQSGWSIMKGLQDAGYSVRLALSGPHALPEALKFEPNLILVNYTLGNETSFKVCELLSAKKELANVPLILIADREGMVREVHREVVSVVQVLPKPFDEKTLLAAVELAIQQPVKAAGETGSQKRPDEEICRSAGREMEGVGGLEAAHFGEVTRTIASRLRDKVLEGLRDGRDPARDKLAGVMVERVLAPDFLQSLAGEVCELALEPGKQGLLAAARTISLSDLLQSLRNSRATGVLTVAGFGNEVEVHLLAGGICFLNPRQISLRFSQDTIYCNYCAIPAAYVEEALAKSQGEDDSMFFRMLEDHTLEPEQVTDLMVSLGLEVLRECVSDQTSCWFRFRPRSALGGRFLQHNADLPVQRLLLKLFTHVDEWNVVQKEIYAAQAYALTGQEPMKDGEDAPTEKQLAILATLDRPHTILEIFAVCRLSPFQVYRSLTRLLQLGLIEKAPLERAPGQSERELEPSISAAASGRGT